MIEFQALRAAIHSILEDPGNREWSVQGIGMMRTYLDGNKRFRLNVWDGCLAIPNVSVIHDHPWDFTSWVISGTFANVRYEMARDPAACLGAPFSWQYVRCGPGGGLDGEHGSCRLLAGHSEVYCTGDVYHQRAEEIHASHYDSGAVTLNDRVPRPDSEHARVFWPHGQNWVDAKPRQADYRTVQDTLKLALKRWSTP
jgi:hypothetical protein